MVVLSETRANVTATFEKLWPGAKVDQILRKRNGGPAARAGVAVVTRVQAASLLIERLEISATNNKDLAQELKVKINERTIVAGVLSPHT